jgi:excisionase family DNA binding protein
MVGELQKLFTLPKVAQRWGVSRDTVRRLIKRGDLPSVTIAARRFVHLDEIEKAESEGVGTPRKSDCPNRARSQSADSLTGPQRKSVKHER